MVSPVTGLSLRQRRIDMTGKGCHPVFYYGFRFNHEGHKDFSQRSTKENLFNASSPFLNFSTSPLRPLSQSLRLSVLHFRFEGGTACPDPSGTEKSLCKETHMVRNDNEAHSSFFIGYPICYPKYYYICQ